MDKLKYKPSDISKANEDAVELPLIAEHNVMGKKFRNKEISLFEWETFEEDWLKRFSVSMHNVVKDRIYVEDTSIEAVQ